MLDIRGRAAVGLLLLAAMLAGCGGSDSEDRGASRLDEESSGGGDLQRREERAAAEPPDQAGGGEEDSDSARPPVENPGQTGSLDELSRGGRPSSGSGKASSGGASRGGARLPGAEGPVYAGARKAPPTGYIAFGKPRERPILLDTYSDAVLVGVRWRSWGGETAAGGGDARVNECTPTCADGSIERRPGARVDLSRLRAGGCAGRPVRFYTRATIRYPPGLRLPARQVLDLIPRCAER